jgi:hypothetical protein
MNTSVPGATRRARAVYDLGHAAIFAAAADPQRDGMAISVSASPSGERS